MGIISFLDQHSGSATVILTFALVSITAYYAKQTRKQVLEAEKLRESQFQPNVYAEFNLGENQWAVKIHIKNNGHGIATDIELNIEQDINNEGLIKVLVPSLVPGQFYDRLIGTSNQLPRTEDRKLVGISLKYKDINGTEYSTSYKQDLEAVIGRSIPDGVPNKYIRFQKTEQMLKLIIDNLQSIATNIKNK